MLAQKGDSKKQTKKTVVTLISWLSLKFRTTLVRCLLLYQFVLDKCFCFVC